MMTESTDEMKEGEMCEVRERKKERERGAASERVRDIHSAGESITPWS